jgi:4-hydroxy-2-oxoheptanedioate aldolase
MDGEHHYFSREQNAWMCAAYRGSGIVPLIRVLSPSGALVRAALDDGATAVIVPYVESIDQVRELVAACKLRPIQGERAVSAMRDEPLAEPQASVSQAVSTNVGLILQIESELAVERCESLLSVPGVDGILIGPYDLSATLGCFQDYEAESFRSAVKHVASVARTKGLGAGIYFAESPARENWALDNGYNLIVQGCDWTLIREALRFRQT